MVEAVENMSYRDLRNFTEMMRALGYTRLISMENFRTPNFPLVAEVLLWLVHRFDPNADILTDVETQQDRIMFITSVAQFMHTKAHIKLNTKKLYQADGYAVRELLKVTSVLYNAMRTNKIGEEAPSEEDSMTTKFKFDITGKINDLKLSRQLASEITAKGAYLHDLLGKEVELREIRSTAIAQPLDVNDIEQGLKSTLKAVEVDLEKTMDLLNNIATNEANLDTKIEKKKSELERNQKRLATLQTVRPAFMDEYERLESELEEVYRLYVDKYRNLVYLESQLEEYERLDQERFEEAESKLKDMARRMHDEENKLVLAAGEGATEIDLANTGELEDDILGETTERQRRPLRNMRRSAGRSGGHKGAVAGENIQMFGSMQGGDDEDDESLESGSDLDLDEDSDEEVEIGDEFAAAGSSKQAQAEELGDSDF